MNYQKKYFHDLSIILVEDLFDLLQRVKRQYPEIEGKNCSF